MAVIFMLISVLSWSLYPVIAAWGIETIALWDFIFLTQVFSVISAWIILKLMPSARAVPYKALFEYDRKDQRHLFYNVITFIASQICLLSSFTYISKVGATIAFESWPIFAMYLTPLLMKKGWDKMPSKDFFFSLIALIGIAFILYPEKNNSFFVHENPDFFHYGMIVLPLIGGVFMALASSFKAGVAQNIQIKKHPVISLLSMQVSMGWFFIPITGAFSLLWPVATPSVYSVTNLLAVAFVGIVIYTLGSLFYTWALLKSHRSNITVLWYFMPIFSAIWFWVSGLSEITDLIIVGAILVISSNLLISTRADRKLAYTITLISLLVVGVGCYFFDGISMGDIYYEAISVPIVFFVVLVAFIMDRLIKRDSIEENIAIDLLHGITQNKALKLDVKRQMISCITKILRTNNTGAVHQQYQKLLKFDRKPIEALSPEIDRLILSKIQGTSFGDLFISALIAFLIAGVTIVFRPEGFVADSFAITLSCSVVFIFFNLVDLANARKEFHLNITADGQRSLDKNLTQENSADVILSMVLIALLLLSLIGLLWFKHY